MNHQAGYGYNFSNPLVKAQFANIPAQNGKVKYDISRMSKDDKELLLFLDFIDREWWVGSLLKKKRKEKLSEQSLTQDNSKEQGGNQAEAPA